MNKSYNRNFLMQNSFIMYQIDSKMIRLGPWNKIFMLLNSQKDNREIFTFYIL